MRTAIIIAAGLLLWGAGVGVTKHFFGASASALMSATLGFTGAWFVAAAVNLRFGVAHAGYSFREEFPIFLLIFLVPALIAAVAKWRFL